MSSKNRLCFASDYMEGAHPAIMDRLIESNMEQSVGYGLDEYSEAARDKIRSEKVELGFWENVDKDHVIMRIATRWATKTEDVDGLIELL